MICVVPILYLHVHLHQVLPPNRLLALPPQQSHESCSLYIGWHQRRAYQHLQVKKRGERTRFADLNYSLFVIFSTLCAMVVPVP